MAKKRKLKTKIKTKIKPARPKSRSKAAFILAIIGIAFLVINAIYVFVAKDTLIKQFQATNFSQSFWGISEQEYQDALSTLPSALNALAIIWIIIAVFALYLTLRLERKEGRWWLLLILGIISLIVGRIDACALLIISSVVYKSSRKTNIK